MEETSVEVIERVPVPPANQLVPLQEKAGHMETTGVVVPVATHTWLTVPDTEVTVPAGNKILQRDNSVQPVLVHSSTSVSSVVAGFQLAVRRINPPPSGMVLSSTRRPVLVP